METWLWLKFSSGQLFSAHKLVNGAACGCFAPWGKKRIVVTHWLCWCISGHFKSDLDTSELIPLPNIIIREMSIVTMWKVVANIRNILNKMWGKSAMRAKRGRVEALNWEKWKEKKWLTKNQRKRKKIDSQLKEKLSSRVAFISWRVQMSWISCWPSPSWPLATCIELGSITGHSGRDVGKSRKSCFIFPSYPNSLRFTTPQVTFSPTKINK